jgi:hypothetical protein
MVFVCLRSAYRRERGDEVGGGKVHAQPRGEEKREGKRERRRRVRGKERREIRRQ